jgi:hypothetical protein
VKVPVTISTRLVAHLVPIGRPSFTPAHEWLHLAPGSQRVVFCSGIAGRTMANAETRSLNALPSRRMRKAIMNILAGS